MPKLISCRNLDSIPHVFRGTPVEKLITYHNLEQKADPYAQAEMAIVTCMDNRLKFKVPDNFAYFIRTGGARAEGFEFHLSFTVDGGVKAFAVIGHGDCGMARVTPESIETVLCNQGWGEASAGKLAQQGMEKFSIDSVSEFTLKQADILKRAFPFIPVAPLFYSVEDHKLSYISAD